MKLDSNGYEAGLTCSNCEPSLSGPPERIRPALDALLEAFEYAKQTASDNWDFAVELERLTAMGLNLNDFRWLVRKSLVEHQREVTRETDNGREFRPNGDLSFPERTCFVLTASGVALARRCMRKLSCDEPFVNSTDGKRNGSNGKHRGSSDSTRVPSAAAVRPTWDSERRLLRLNGKPIKHFKWTARNQETILSAFEEENWPPRIDDPLPPQPEQDSKRRLSDAIKCLNRKQVNPAIHFRGDGTGEGIVWELVE